MSFIKELAISIPILIVIVIIASHIAAVPTGSMSPSIEEGDLVIVEKVDVLGLFEEFDPESVKEGDIIIYEESTSNGEETSTSNGEEASDSHGEESSSNDGEEMIIHRVVAINETPEGRYFILKGDANQEVDEEQVNSSYVEARIVTWDGKPLTIPQLGWVLLWFK